MRLTGLKRVYIVDDEEDIRTVACMALELIGGFVVGQAASGEQALAEAAAFGPNLILLDVMMPGMDGPASLKLMLADPDLSHIPVIFMTGMVQPQEVSAFLAMGDSAVIAKPFEAMKLAAQLHEIWNRSL